MAGRGRRPSIPKATEGAVNAQGWAREPPALHGAAALVGFADKSTGSGSRVGHSDVPEQTSNLADTEGVLCVNSLVPTRALDTLDGKTPATSQPSGPGRPVQSHATAEAGGLSKGGPSLKSLQDTLCKLEADKERSVSHAARCKKSFDRLAMVNAFQTPSLTARLRAAASSESNPDPATGDSAGGMDPMHSDGSALTSRDANHGAEAEGGANTGPTAERIESIDVGEKATGTAAPEMHSDGSALTSRDANHGAEAEGGANTGPTAERIESIDVGEKATGTAAPEWPKSEMQDHGDFGNQHGRGFSQGTGQSVANGAAEPTVRQVGHAQPPSSSASGRCRGGVAQSPPPSMSPGHAGGLAGGARAKQRRHSSPAPQPRSCSGGMGSMGEGGGLQLSGVKAELQTQQQSRPGVGQKQRTSSSPDRAHMHDYLRKGGAGLQAAGRPRSRSRGPDEIRAEGQHVSMGGIDGLPGHYTGTGQESDESRGVKSTGLKAKAKSAAGHADNQADSQNAGSLTAGHLQRSDSASASTHDGHQTQASTSEGGADQSAHGSHGPNSCTDNIMQDQRDSDRPTKDLEELDDIEIDDVEELQAHTLKDNMKHLRKLVMVLHLWTGSKDKENGREKEEEEEEVGGESNTEATYSSLDEPVKQVFDVVATVKVRSGGKLCTQKSFEAVMDALQTMDQGKHRGFKKIPLSTIREAFQEQISLQISLSSRYGLSAAEASKGMVFETFRTCVHRLFYRPLEKEEDVKQMLLRMDRG